MHHIFNDLKLLQNHSTFRHVSVAATTIITRESSSCKLEHRRYKTQFVLLSTRSKTHFTTFMDVKTR
jgi:hypothetical protein